MKDWRGIEAVGVSHPDGSTSWTPPDGYEPRFFRKGDPREAADPAHWICCESCKTLLYRSRGWNIMLPDPDDDFGMCGNVYMGIDIDGKWRIVICSKECLVAWANSQAPERYAGGRPIIMSPDK